MYDSNADGCLDRKEIGSWRLKYLVKKGKWNFSSFIGHILTLIYEINRHGTVKEDGVKADRRARQIIEKFDLNGDRKLSRDEFVNGCLHNPDIRKLLIQ